MDCGREDARQRECGLLRELRFVQDSFSMVTRTRDSERMEHTQEKAITVSVLASARHTVLVVAEWLLVFFPSFQ